MSYPTHIICNNKHFYYQAKVPVDLKQYFGCIFIKKSLHTKNLSDAKTLLIAMEYKICKAFRTLRTGMLTDDLVGQVVEEIIPDRNGKRYQPKVLLDALIKLDYGV